MITRDTRTVNIMGVEWTIKYVPTMEQGSCGECDYLTQTIRIVRRMSRVMQVRTLCHELVHAAGLGEEAAECAEILAGILVVNNVKFAELEYTAEEAPHA